MPDKTNIYGWDGTQWVKILVNAAGKLIIDPSEILEDTPTDNEVGKAPTSNWAHDHNANADAHHAQIHAHASHTGIGADDHHAQAHTLASHSTKAHSELTGVGSSDHHVRYADSEALAAAWANIDTKSFINLLSNGDFEVGDPPTGWTLEGAGCTVSRSAVQKKCGSYSALVTRVTNDAWYHQNTSDYLRYAGRKVTVGAWVYATVGNCAYIYVDTGAGGAALSPKHSGVAGWEWLTATLTIGTPGFLQFGLAVRDFNTSVYLDGAMLVEGDSCPAFSPKPASLEYADAAIDTDIATHTAIPTAHQTKTKEFFIPVTFADGGGVMGPVYYFPAAMLEAAGEMAYICFQVPLDFTSITSAEIIVIPLATQAAADWNIYSMYGAVGEHFGTHFASDVATTYNVTLEVLFAVSIAGILTSLAAGDIVGIKIGQFTAGHNVAVLGIRFKYT